MRDAAIALATATSGRDPAGMKATIEAALEAQAIKDDADGK
jgi:hypothetical protein